MTLLLKGAEMTSFEMSSSGVYVDRVGGESFSDDVDTETKMG